MSEASAPRTDAAFRPTLDSSLSIVEFPTGGTAHKLEAALNSIINNFVETARDDAAANEARLLAASSIRKVIVVWNIDAPLGSINRYGDEVDKFSMTYNAMSTLRENRECPWSIEWQIVKCIISSYREDVELTSLKLREITDAASKVYILMMQELDAQGAPDSPVQDPMPETATYTAWFQTPTESDEAESKDNVQVYKRTGSIGLGDGSNTRYVGLEHASGISAKQEIVAHTTGDGTDWLPRRDSGDGAARKTGSVAGTHRSRLYSETSPSKLDSATNGELQPKTRGIGRGNFLTGPMVPWYAEEDEFGKQCIRDHPNRSWEETTNEINRKFEGTRHYHEVTGDWGPERKARTTGAVTQRFTAFRREVRIANVRSSIVAVPDKDGRDDKLAVTQQAAAGDDTCRTTSDGGSK